MTASDDDLIQKGQDDLIRRGDARRILEEEGFLERSLANLNNLPAVQVAVTPLEFIYGKAESVIGIYLIDSGWKDKVGGDRWWAWAGPTDTDNDRDPFYVWQHGTRIADEEAAKAAAQADYEARIRSALTAHPSPEQVTAYSENDVEVMVKALEFYADRDNYEPVYERMPCDCCTEIYEPVKRDEGDIARAALARVKGGE